MTRKECRANCREQLSKAERHGALTGIQLNLSTENGGPGRGKYGARQIDKHGSVRSRALSATRVVCSCNKGKKITSVHTITQPKSIPKSTSRPKRSPSGRRRFFLFGRKKPSPHKRSRWGFLEKNKPSNVEKSVDLFYKNTAEFYTKAWCSVFGRSPMLTCVFKRLMYYCYGSNPMVALISIVLLIIIWWAMRITFALFMNIIVPFLVVILAIMLIPPLRGPIIDKNFNEICKTVNKWYKWYR